MADEGIRVTINPTSGKRLAESPTSSSSSFAADKIYRYAAALRRTGHRPTQRDQRRAQACRDANRARRRDPRAAQNDTWHRRRIE